MKWTEEQISYLLENYPINPSIWKMSGELNKTVKAIHRKAQRLNLHREAFTKKPKKRIPKKTIDKKYYLKNKGDIYQRKRERIKKLREEFKLLLGGKCCRCNYNKCLFALEFHHSLGKKEGHLSHMIKNLSKQKVLKELKKCILLCANCHRELHKGL